jgi:cyclohexa-1,5-dienecarbonyl-CoA hydratase
MEENATAPGIATRDQAGMFQVIFNRQPHNNLSLDVVEEINAAIASVLYRRDLKVVVFSAAGKTFCSGFAAEDFVNDRSFQLIEAYGKLYRQLETLSLPVVSIIQGPAVGAGMELVLYSDFAIAAESAKLGFLEIGMGIFPAIACNLLPRSIPPKRAAELLFTGDLITAADAHKLNLISKVVPDEKLQEEAKVIISKLLQFSAPVLQLTKRAMNESLGKSFEAATEAVDEIYLNSLLGLQDSQEGIRARIEKRKPVWKNQ